MSFGAWFNDFWASTGITLIKVFAILVFGLLLIRIIMRYASKGLKSSSMEAGLSSFLLSVIKVVLYIILIFLVLSTLGVSMGAFIAALSAAGLAIALALQDSLSNLASGILILVNKPFVEGDYIKVGSEEGSVKSVRIFTTQIETSDKKIITLPNKSIVNGNVINYTSSPLRRLDITFCVPFGTNQQFVKEVVNDTFDENKYIMKSPAKEIFVDNYDEHGLRFVLKMWCKSEEYWDLYEDAYTKLTDALHNAGIQITNNQSVIKLSDEEINTRKSQLKKSIELRKEAELKKQNKNLKKMKIEIIDDDGKKYKNKSSSVAVSYQEPIVLDSSIITDSKAMLTEPQEKVEEKQKKKKRIWGRKNDK